MPISIGHGSSGRWQPATRALGGDVEQNGYVFSLDRLSAIRPARGQIQARYFRGLNGHIRRRGADPREVLSEAGVDPVALADPDNHLDCWAMAGALDWCGRYFDDPLFGLGFSDEQDIDVFGIVAVLARAAPDLRTAFRCLVDYLPVMHSPEGPVRTVRSAGTVELRSSAPGHLGGVEQTTYQGTFLMLRMVRALAGGDCRLRYFGLACDMSAATIGRLRDRLGCTVFRSEENVAAFDADILDRPIGSANAMLFELLDGLLAAAKGHATPGLAGQVEAYIRAALPSGTCTIERCAARIGISTRMLQKRLAGEGLSFLRMVDSGRACLARQALAHGRKSLDDVALALGYSDQACFGRAFKRWTGTTPDAFRARAAIDATGSAA